MSLLGFDALGRFALGQISQVQDANPVVAQAAGTGVARSVTPTIAIGLTQVAGIGVAGTIAAPQLSLTVPRAVGVGVAGALFGADQAFLTGVSGVGVAGTLGAIDQVTLAQAIGTGIAGIVTTSSTAPALPGVAGIGVAGSIIASPSSALQGVSCTGLAGRITVIISGGGGAAATGDGDRRRKAKTGLEPVKKRPPEPPVAVEAPKLPLPPFKDAPALVPAIEAPEIAKRPAASSAMAMLRDQIEAAKHASDAARQLRADEQAIASFLRDDDQDQQDAEDIADILALLD